MEDNANAFIVDIEPLKFSHHIGYIFLNITMYMCVAFMVSILTVGDESNQIIILSSYVCVILLLLFLNVIRGFRRPFTYIYRIGFNQDKEVFAIKYRQRFRDYFLELPIKNIGVQLEEENGKKLTLLITDLNSKYSYSIKQTEISQWKKKLIVETYHNLNRILNSKSCEDIKEIRS
ncbi:hypothetical protein [Winogradskyella vidalii]|uniref:hypothetical protein n=1 Tax=Winogradskyella vidalii TaxID=2615024 RepID=UPI0015CB726D|nr:hypothetical protein [Winogradskyella vidalii]